VDVSLDWCDSNLFLEAVMHTTTIHSAHSLGIVTDRMPSPWRSRLRPILDRSWSRKNDEAEPDSLYRLDDWLLADVGLYREHRVHNPQDRTDPQRRSVPVALLAIWMPPV
jgi:hypothetical protein